MVVKSKYRSNSSYDQDDYSQTSSETGADSPVSGDELVSVVVPSAKKSRRSIKKRVVHVPVGDLSRSKSDAYPPSDSWAWRKYGQKPIKGSPYPRGYYRCSSSKGCPARKQVERSRVDPKMLVITYASEHNHPLPTFKHHHKTVAAAAATRSCGNTVSPSTPPDVAVTSPVGANESTDEDVSELLVTPEHVNPFGEAAHLEFVGDTLMLGNLGIEYNWIPDFTFNTPVFVSPKFEDVEVEMLTMREEDELLFGELDELPECSAVFRRGQESDKICAHVTTLCSCTST